VSAAPQLGPIRQKHALWRILAILLYSPASAEMGLERWEDGSVVFHGPTLSSELRMPSTRFYDQLGDLGAHGYLDTYERLGNGKYRVRPSRPLVHWTSTP